MQPHTGGHDVVGLIISLGILLAKIAKLHLRTEHSVETVRLVRPLRFSHASGTSVSGTVSSNSNHSRSLQHPALSDQPAYRAAMHPEHFGNLRLRFALIDHGQRMELALWALRLAGLNPAGKALAKQADLTEFHCSREFMPQLGARCVGAPRSWL